MFQYHDKRASFPALYINQPSEFQPTGHRNIFNNVKQISSITPSISPNIYNQKHNSRPFQHITNNNLIVRDSDKNIEQDDIDYYGNKLYNYM